MYFSEPSRISITVNKRGYAVNFESGNNNGVFAEWCRGREMFKEKENVFLDYSSFLSIIDGYITS